MAEDLARVRVQWTGVAGMPGVTTFMFTGAETPPLAAVRAFCTTIATGIPSSVTLQIENQGQTVDMSTGKAVGAWSGPTQAAVPGSGGTLYAAPVGAMINWNTGTFVNGRHVRGKTFIVPTVVNVFDAAGHVKDEWRNGVTAAAQALITASSGRLAIYRRSSGGLSTVSTGACSAKAVVLTSRRD